MAAPGRAHTYCLDVSVWTDSKWILLSVCLVLCGCGTHTFTPMETVSKPAVSAPAPVAVPDKGGS